jgi:hypothetical protein
MARWMVIAVYEAIEWLEDARQRGREESPLDRSKQISDETG